MSIGRLRGVTQHSARSRSLVFLRARANPRLDHRARESVRLIIVGRTGSQRGGAHVQRAPMRNALILLAVSNAAALSMCTLARRPSAPTCVGCRSSHSHRMMAAGGTQYRAGQPGDELLISSTMFKEKMNPLGIKHERFIVATGASGDTIGFGQIRDLGDGGGLWEIASLYVNEGQRSRGIGTELVRRLLAAHESRGHSLDALYLLTLEPTTPFYQALGFRLAAKDEVPQEMALEVAAGTALSFVLGNKLVCMRHGGSVPPNE